MIAEYSYTHYYFFIIQTNSVHNRLDEMRMFEADRLAHAQLIPTYKTVSYWKK